MKTLKHISFTFFLTTFIMLTGCSVLTHKHTDRSIQQAEIAGFNHKIIPTQHFKITTWYKVTNPSAPLVFYIEGDGHSVHRHRPSHNPTPYQPLALDLAILDQRPNVIYIARPCQYTPLESDPKCQQIYWFTHKLSPKVIEATQEVIRHYQAQHKNAEIHLVGFSGGGGLAALVTAQMQAVSTLTTVAGDLNLEAMHQHHHTTPLWGSINPISQVDQLREIPQIHWVGKKDPIVPPKIVQTFIETLHSPCAQIRVLDKVGHHEGWKSHWPQIIQESPRCSMPT